MQRDASETPAPKAPAKSSRRFIYRLFVLVMYAVAFLCLVMLGVATLAFLTYQHVTRTGVTGPTVPVTIPEGATGQDIAQLLEEHELVEHGVLFRLALRLTPEPQPIRHGIYEIARGHSPMQILEQLHEGPRFHLQRNQVRITIPEGLSLSQMAELFDQPAAFLEAASNPEYRETLGLRQEVAHIEGYLMPDTYFFDAIPTEAEVVDRMFRHFLQSKSALESELPPESALTFHDVVTIASLVEREARIPDERPLVAAVILNRLDMNMPLQMDSTLQYALHKYGQRMLDADKEVDSPYNTYRYRGLPPGPIASPSRSSIEAVLQPAEVDYLYFVSNADGQTHTFSSNYDDHLRAVQRYRRDIAEQRRSQESP